MVSLGSLRKKLVYTFLASALVMVVLFSIVIRGIASDYFKRQSDARLQFVQDQSRQAVRENLSLFKDRLQQMFAAGTVALNSMCRAGTLGDSIDRLPRNSAEREITARHLQMIQGLAKLSLITLVDTDGKVVVRATNPSAFGDDALMHDYSNAGGPVSSITHLLRVALNGQPTTSFESIAPEVLTDERTLEGGKPVSSLRNDVAIPLKGKDIPTGAQETRALALTFAAPVFDSEGKIVGAALAARIFNKDLSIVQDVHNLLQDEATVFFGQVRDGLRPEQSVRITTTIKTRTGAIGTLHRDPEATNTGLYSERKSIGRINGEELMGAFDPIQDNDGAVLGSLYIGRPLSFLDDIAKKQAEIETAVEQRTTYYIIGLALVSMLLAVIIASIFSARMTKQIDKLRIGAETISNGNLDYRLEIKTGDEIQLLAQQFNSMASKLKDSYQTLEKKVEERTRELKESQEAMIQQEKMVGVGQLAAGIAHELNTPLGTIIGYAQMLKEDLALQPAVNGTAGDVDEIIEQAGRCRDLVKNLLNFSRRSSTEKSQADINAIVRKIMSLVEHDFELKHMAVRLNLDQQLPNAKVNENEIAQVILNLANNAADSMPGGGEIRVSTSYDRDTDRIRIDVHDTGTGIAESDRNRVFEPFFTTKEVGKGTGLGLSICYKIIENHMGSMEFDSVVGQGTTFRIYIPVNAEVRVA